MRKAVVEKAINGDAKSLETLLKKHYQQLYKTAFLYVKQESDALDIVQDAVIKIINNIRTLEYPEYFSTWAVRIVIFTSLDYLRKHKVFLDDIDESEALNWEEALSREAELDIHEGIRRLPQHLQEITILHYFFGKKLKEISEVSGEPLGTIKYKLYEARKMLKEYLEEEGEA